VDSPSNAVLVASRKATTFHDENVAYGDTYYYWARVVGHYGERSPLSPSVGHSITVAPIRTSDVDPAWPGAHVYANSLPTLPNGVTTVLDFDTERYDTAGLHDSGSHPSRLTAPIAGQYLIIGSVSFNAGAGVGQRDIRVRINGVDFSAITQVPADSVAVTTMQITTVTRLVATDYAELAAYQNSGGDHDVAGAMFSMHWIGP
jgi:hypothetical protein